MCKLGIETLKLFSDQILDLEEVSLSLPVSCSRPGRLDPTAGSKRMRPIAPVEFDRFPFDRKPRSAVCCAYIQYFGDLNYGHHPMVAIQQRRSASDLTTAHRRGFSDAR